MPTVYPDDPRLIKVIPNYSLNRFISRQEEWEITNEFLKEQIVLWDRLKRVNTQEALKVMKMIKSQDMEMNVLGVKTGWEYIKQHYEERS